MRDFVLSVGSPIHPVLFALLEKKSRLITEEGNVVSIVIATTSGTNAVGRHFDGGKVGNQGGL
jgi:hypothetical protein